MTTSRRRGGFFRPPQTEQVEGGVGRILSTIKWTTLWTLCALALLFLIAVILGPWSGWALGLVVLLYLSKPACLWMMRTHNWHARFVVCSVMVAILVCYAVIGYPAIAREWPPYEIRIPFWADCCVVVLSLGMEVVLILGLWGMVTELFDPAGPAALRQAVPRDKAIYPWSIETYGGTRLPLIERDPLPPIMPYRRIKLMLVDRQNNLMAFADIEDSPRMRDFAKAIGAGKSFSERTARDIGPGDLGFSRRDWIVEIREPFLNREWAEWKDKEHPEQGVRLLPEGYDFWVELANENFEED